MIDSNALDRSIGQKFEILDKILRKQNKNQRCLKTRKCRNVTAVKVWSCHHGRHTVLPNRASAHFLGFGSGSVRNPFGVRSGSVLTNFVPKFSDPKIFKFKNFQICAAVAAAAEALRPHTIFCEKVSNLGMYYHLWQK